MKPALHPPRPAPDGAIAGDEADCYYRSERRARVRLLLLDRYRMLKQRFRLGSLPSLSLILALMALVGIAVFNASVDSSLLELRGTADKHLDIYATSLESEIARYTPLPSILSLAPAVDALLRHPDDPEWRLAGNRYLEQLSLRTGASAIYLQDTRGRVIATSNWRRTDSYLGENDAFRPYFSDAMAGHAGRFFGVGTTRSEAGYYLSEGVPDRVHPLGVAVVKISLARLERAWSDSHSRVLVSDQDNVVILAEPPEWKYHTLRPLDAATQQRLMDKRQYNRVPLRPLPLQAQQQLGPDSRIVTLAGNASDRAASWFARPRFFEHSRRLASANWRLTALLDLRETYALALIRSASAALLATLGLTGLLLLNEKRLRVRDQLAAREQLAQAYHDMERQVVARTADLSDANALLQDEIAERIRTEQHLRAAQDNLVQAGKMAVVGQLSTGIAHELNQPLAALRTLSGNAVRFLERGDLETVGNNLNMSIEMVERMGRITGSLRAFARKSTERAGRAHLGRAIDNALFLLEARWRRLNVTIVRHSASADLTALCDPNRLEQVLVNLLSNALDALADTPAPQIEISTLADGGEVLILLRDNGPGLSPQAREHLFEPFFTTKPTGAGLGLGLTLSSGIIAEAGGTLKGDNFRDGGALFTLTLPGAMEEGHD
jgi:two-component system C4-dicarboxylate transport sensor histidine kinase DctB